MRMRTTPLEGIYVIEPSVIEDERGYFMESYRQEWFKHIAPHINFIQDNESLSVHSGTLRGIHYQLPPSKQTKLVRVTQGAIYDVAVDIRKGSPTFGQYFAIELSAENKKQLYIAKGFAHAFITLLPHTRVNYKVDESYDKAADRGIIWNDGQINIQWPAAVTTISDKDQSWPTLTEAEWL